jgi:hypothetical protein
MLVGRPAHFFSPTYRQTLPRHLLHDLPELLEDAPQAVRARMWYMRDGAPVHSSRAVRDAVSNTYYGGWTGTGGPVE